MSQVNRNKRSTIIYLLVILTSSFCLPTFAEISHPVLDSLPIPESDVEENDNSVKCFYEPASDEWIDRFRSNTHSRVCRTVFWVDRQFGEEHKFDDENLNGKLSLGFRQDEIEGFDPKLRVRIRAKLPNVSDSLNAFVGRVEEDSFISNTEVDNGSVSNVGLRSTNDEDDDWLLGLGYRDPNRTDNGFDLSVGAKLSSGLAPFAKITHRYLFKPSQQHLWRTTQTIFWRREDKFGFSSNLDYTYLLNDTNIFEWDTSFKHTEENTFTEWVTSGIWHHSFGNRTGFSSRIYVRGETEQEVGIPEFGTAFTYITPFLRPWFFVEAGIDYRWEKEFRQQQEYDSAIRFSLQFQMLLGDYYARFRRD